MSKLISPNHFAAPRAQATSDEFHVGKLLLFLLRHKYLFGVFMGAALLTVSFEHLTFPSFKAKAYLAIQGSGNSPLQALTAKITGIGSQDSDTKDAEKYVSVLRSYDFYMGAARALRESPEYGQWKSKLHLSDTFLSKLRNMLPRANDPKSEATQDEAIADLLAHWVSFSIFNNSSISVIATTPEKETTFFIINFIAEKAVNAIISHGIKELNDTEKYLKEQLAEREKSIREIDQSMVQFKNTNHLISFDGAGTESASRSAEIKKEIDDISIDMDQNSRLIETMSTDLRSSEARAAVSGTDDNPDALAESQKTKFSLPKKIADLKRQNAFLKVRKGSLNKILDQMLQSRDPHYEQKIYELRKQMELEYSLFQDLKKQAFQIEMGRISFRNKVQLSERARRSEVQRSESLTVKMLMALVIALFVAGPLAYLWELSLPLVKTKQDLMDMGLVFLGSVPDLASLKKSRRFINFQDKKNQPGKTDFILRFDAGSTGSMSFVHIRSRILHLSESKGRTAHVVSIMSPQHQEGKSFIVRNIASCIAYTKKKTLIIDGDIRKGDTSRFFGASEAKGLGELLASKTKFGEVVMREVLPHVDLLAAGLIRADITEMIASDAMTQLIEDLKAVYDHIIIDTSAVEIAPDSLLIAKRADLAVLVATCNKTSRSSLNHAIDGILSLDQRQIYAILNKAVAVHDHLYAVSDTQIERRSFDRRNSARDA